MVLLRQNMQEEKVANHHWDTVCFRFRKSKKEGEKRGENESLELVSLEVYLVLKVKTPDTLSY